MGKIFFIFYYWKLKLLDTVLLIIDNVIQGFKQTTSLPFWFSSFLLRDLLDRLPFSCCFSLYLTFLTFCLVCHGTDLFAFMLFYVPWTFQFFYFFFQTSGVSCHHFLNMLYVSFLSIISCDMQIISFFLFDMVQTKWLLVSYHLVL